MMQTQCRHRITPSPTRAHLCSQRPRALCQQGVCPGLHITDTCAFIVVEALMLIPAGSEHPHADVEGGEMV